MLPSGGTRMWLLVVVAVAAATRGASGQVLGLGKCPAQAVVQNFDVNRYTGTWYEYSNYFAIFQLGGRCVTATYKNLGNGRISVRNRQIGALGKENVIDGEARLESTKTNEAKLTVSFNGMPSFGGGSNYWVLDTDYINYAIVWSCSDIGISNFQILWILTRTRFPDQATVNYATNIIRKRGLDASKLERTSQESCT